MGTFFPVRSRWLPVSVAIGVAFSLLFGPAQAARAIETPASFEACLLQHANEERAALGIAPLQMATDLVPAVRDWSEWMSNNEFEHMPSATRNAILPPNTTTWAENIAWHGNENLPNCAAIHDMWMNSSGHRANILNSSMQFVAIGTYVDGSGWWATQLFFNSSSYPFTTASGPGSQMFFYRDDGLYGYYNTNAYGSLTSTIKGGSNYTSGWDSITAVDLDGDGQDEMFFYRSDGLYRYYNINTSGTLTSLIKGGSNYTSGWDTITAVDLDGDGQDEMFFYRSDGLYRYYNINSSGTLTSTIKGGSNYTNGWDTITAVDLDGDGQDEMFFYRSDGLYRYYDITATGSLSTMIKGGNAYTSGWDSIAAVDLDGDGQDEMFFYRSDGLYRYYNISSTGSLGTMIKGGTTYTNGWDIIGGVDLG